MPTAGQQRNPAGESPQATEPLLCRCRLWRQGRLSDHRNWRAEYDRALRAGRIADEFHFAAIAIVGRIDLAEATP